MTASKKKLSFEQSIEKIDSIIDQMEKGEIELEESVKSYEEAMNMILQCHKILDDVEGKLMKVVEKDGKLEFSEFK